MVWPPAGVARWCPGLGGVGAVRGPPPLWVSPAKATPEGERPEAAPAADTARRATADTTATHDERRATTTPNADPYGPRRETRSGTEGGQQNLVPQ